MSVRSGFFNSDKDTPGGERKYDANDFGKMFDGLIRDGVFSTYGEEDIDHNIYPFKPKSVHDTGRYEFKIGVGRSWFNHHWLVNDSIINIYSPNGSLPIWDRIDAIVIEVNEETRECNIKWIEGEGNSEGGDPVKPEMIHTDTVNQYALLYVYVEHDTNEVRDDTLANHGWESVIGHDETPFVTGILQQASVESIMQSWIESWETTQTEKQEEFENEFREWFEHIQRTLDEDAAGHLANGIHEIWTYLNNIGTAEEVEY